MTKRVLSLVAVGAALVSFTGCVANNNSTTAADGVIEVKISDDSCEVSANSVGSGTVKFKLVNNGSVRNEFEILAPDKLRIVGERENLGPGTTTDYTIVLEPGQYFTACKKNMVGALVGTKEFTVTDSGKKVEVSADEEAQRKTAVTNYTAYIKDQVGQLLSATEEFAAAYRSGDFDKARKMYAPARMYYERIEPTAEAFGDIDPALDEREADWQEADDKGTRKWTGWHVAEKDMWRPSGFAGLSEAERTEIANGLVADTKKLYDQVYSANFSVSLDDISNGAIGLLEEVATSKITGEEEAFSHTDLWDFQANVEGAKVAFGNVESIAKAKNPDLASEITRRFTELDEVLAKYKSGDGYVTYDTLNETQRRELTDKVNALRVPLAKLTEAVLG